VWCVCCTVAKVSGAVYVIVCMVTCRRRLNITRLDRSDRVFEFCEMCCHTSLFFDIRSVQAEAV